MCDFDSNTCRSCNKKCKSKHDVIVLLVLCCKTFAVFTGKMHVIINVRYQSKTVENT